MNTLRRYPEEDSWWWCRRPLKGSPEKILTFLKLSDCLLTVEHGQKINSYNLSHIEYPNGYNGWLAWWSMRMTWVFMGIMVNDWFLYYWQMNRQTDRLLRFYSCFCDWNVWSLLSLLVGMDSCTYLLDGFGILLRSFWGIWLDFRNVLTVLPPWILDTKSILTKK